MLGSWRRLKQVGVLGMNRRNSDFTLRYNPRHLLPLVDDKLLTKRLAQQAGISVPELYSVVEIEHQVHGLHEALSPYPDFVVKPARGSGGDGIVVIAGRSKGMYLKVNGALLARDALEHHVSNILGGIYSLGGYADKALVEYRVQFDPVFQAISYQGVPDVRIIVFLGVPVMAMVRLPSLASEGKANLHQGAIGAGVDMASGRTLAAVWRNEVVTEHPDTGQPVSDVLIPHWPRMLEIAARCYEMTGLGYQGVDIVLDGQRGPMMLEINARPGLNIQIANRAGLLPRLRRVEAEHYRLHDLDARVAFSVSHFGAGDGAVA
ncbi:MAG: alpha-L-glutamate ligase-like protein [Gammaproteobacteria bacterium]